MPDNKQPTEQDRERAGVYKGYSIRWLKKLREEGEPHPSADSLIEEYENKK